MFADNHFCRGKPYITMTKLGPMSLNKHFLKNKTYDFEAWRSNGSNLHYQL